MITEKMFDESVKYYVDKGSDINTMREDIKYYYRNHRKYNNLLDALNIETILS